MNLSALMDKGLEHVGRMIDIEALLMLAIIAYKH